MIIDKNFKLFGKVSIVDICALLILIGGVLFAIEFSAPIVAANPGDVKIRYTVELSRKTKEFLPHIKTGEKIYDVLKGYEIGTLVDCYTLPNWDETADFEADVIRRADYPYYDLIYLVIEAEAQVMDSHTTIGAYDVPVGRDVYIKSKHFSSSGYIVKLEIEDLDKIKQKWEEMNNVDR